MIVTFFRLMEEAMTSDDGKCFEKLCIGYLIKGDGFDKFGEFNLPETLRNSHLYDAYLVEALESISDK